MFWDRFSFLCSKIGKKPNPIAAEIGFSSTMVTKYKRGAMPNGEILSKTADYFGCSVDYLLGRSDQPLPTASEDTWRKTREQLSDASRTELEHYLDYLLWKQAQEAEVSK